MITALRLPAIAFLATVLTITAYERSVLEFGAKGDAKTDSTPAFQRALDDVAAHRGGIVRVPTGRYRLNGTLTIGNGVTLQGTYTTPPTAHGQKVDSLLGSVLLAYAGRNQPDAAPFIVLKGTAATLAGVIIMYPEWKQTDVPPVPYPPTIAAGRVDNVSVNNCLLLNAYEGIHLDGTGRFLIRNVYGYPSKRGIYVNRCLDIGRIENCHFWPFAVRYNPTDPYCKWVNTNGVAYEFARTDWQTVTGCFCFGYGTGYRFSRSKEGVFCGKLVGSSADCCEKAIEVIENGHILISNGEFVGRWTSGTSVTLDIGEESRGKVSLQNCVFWGPIKQAVHSRAHQGRLSIIGCEFRNWHDEIGAIAVEGGKAIIQANNFTKPGINVRIGKEVTSAILTANQAVPGFRVENHAGERTIIANNETDPFHWPNEAAKGNYQIDIGDPGDFRYMQDWNGCEPALEWDGKGTKRWSKGSSKLTVPVLPNTAYRGTLDIMAPGHAVNAHSGIYENGKRLAAITKGGHATISFALPASPAKERVLELRCKAWRPVELTRGKNRDSRELGIAVRSLLLQKVSAKPGDPVFNACTGEEGIVE